MKNIYLLITTACLFITGGVFSQSQPCSHFSNVVTASRGTNDVGSTANTAREAQYDVKFYFLDLALDKNVSTVSGNVLSRVNTVATNMDTFSVELASVFTVDSAVAKLNTGSFQAATVLPHTNSDLNIDLPFTAHANDIVEVRIYYHGTANTSAGNPSGDAFFLYTGPVFSASPPYNSSTWWPCKQNLTDKADSSWFFITTDTSARAVSNGSLTNIASVSSTHNRWEWKSSYPINFYLISFVVGAMDKEVQFFHPTGRTDSMVVEYYNNVDKGNTLDILQKFSDKFGLYPFYKEKYGLAKVTLGGGMENQTIVSLGAAGTVIEHETMHQWFGDNVSIGSFRDLALSEGFARWAETLYPELTSGTPNATRIAGLTSFETSALTYASGSVYNYSSDTSSIFGLYTGQGYAMYYNKAAMVINSLRFVVDNDSLFFLGLQNYQTAMAGKSATGNDLRDAMENTTGIDLTDFFDQWYYGYGYPTFSLKWNQKETKLNLLVKETTSSVNTPLFKTPLEIKIKRLNGVTVTDTILRIMIESDSSAFGLNLGNDSITGFTIDPNQWIVNKAGAITVDASLNIGTTTGIKPLENDKAAYTVYPNPAAQSITIQSNLPANIVVETELYNMVGQRVRYERIYGTQPLSVADLPEGIYLLRINGAATQKVVIAH